MTISTEIVVWEEYWARQQRVLAELSGVDNDEVERIKIAVISAARAYGKAIGELTDMFIEAMSMVADILSEAMGQLADRVAKLLDEIGVTEHDDYFTICDKFENYAIYAERKLSIQREQYYKSCFKLAKINYAVRNHDRR